MTRWKALALVAVAAAGLGCERTPLLPPADNPTKPGVRPGPDAGNDPVSDTLAPLPEIGKDAGKDVGEEVGKPDLPVAPEVAPSPDTVEVRPPLPDAGPDLGPAPTDGKRDLPPVSPPDVLPPPPFDTRPDLATSRPEVATVDLRPVSPDGPPVSPDGPPPPQRCASGEACTSDCKVPCQVIGTTACTCVGGTLTCGACQQPNLVLTPTPCPSNAADTVCDTSGQACPVYTRIAVTGLCACLDLGQGLRWNCLSR